MTDTKTILVVEDEKGIRNFIHNALTTNGYKTILAENGRNARAAFLSQCPDLVLLDLGLPDMDGIELLKEFRQWMQTPILIVSARDKEAEKVMALDLGADDYITKPFGISELMARVRAALRHKSLLTDNSGVESVIRIKDLTIDIAKHTVTKNGEEIHFTQNEFKCLVLLGRHAGKVLTYDFIMKNIWGPYSPSDNQILRVNMANIRRKLKENPAEPKYILTELGIGYRMLIE
ncbi:MAG: response regulator transcription factor [Lachnospiraceae bacterium]|nr:response regulator transcription factor [Lachnospiraceae bacterium]